MYAKLTKVEDLPVKTFLGYRPIVIRTQIEREKSLVICCDFNFDLYFLQSYWIMSYYNTGIIDATFVIFEWSFDWVTAEATPPSMSNEALKQESNNILILSITF